MSKPVHMPESSIRGFMLEADPEWAKGNAKLGSLKVVVNGYPGEQIATPLNPEAYGSSMFGWGHRGTAQMATVEAICDWLGVAFDDEDSRRYVSTLIANERNKDRMIDTKELNGISLSPTRSFNTMEKLKESIPDFNGSREELSVIEGPDGRNWIPCLTGKGHVCLALSEHLPDELDGHGVVAYIGKLSTDEITDDHVLALRRKMRRSAIAVDPSIPHRLDEIHASLISVIREVGLEMTGVDPLPEKPKLSEAGRSIPSMFKKSIRGIRRGRGAPDQPPVTLEE